MTPEISSVAGRRSWHGGIHVEIHFATDGRGVDDLPILRGFACRERWVAATISNGIAGLSGQPNNKTFFAECLCVTLTSLS
jgi:hypothetical protein